MKQWQIVFSDGSETVVRGDSVLCVFKLAAELVAQIVRIELMLPT